MVTTLFLVYLWRNREVGRPSIKKAQGGPKLFLPTMLTAELPQSAPTAGSLGSFADRCHRISLRAAAVGDLHQGNRDLLSIPDRHAPDHGGLLVDDD